jgi:hypothetical protein
VDASVNSAAAKKLFICGIDYRITVNFGYVLSYYMKWHSFSLSLFSEKKEAADWGSSFFSLSCPVYYQKLG